MALPARPAWHKHAACHGRLDQFFIGRGEDQRPALALCAICTVRQTCLDTALDDDTLTGIWGGTTSIQRDRIRRRKQHP